MKRYRLLWIGAICGVMLCIGFFSFGEHGEQQPKSAWRVAEARTPSAPSQVEMTWMSITNWFLEMNGVKIVADGYITRIAREDFGPPAVPDVDAVQRVFDAIGGEVNFIVAGHSHFDHTFDTATWARLSGAVIIGSRSTCLQAIAQGIPESQCKRVKGGEVFDLGSGVTMRVVQWNHSGSLDTPEGVRLQAPVELIEAPVPDPETGGLRPGIGRDFPNGGGAHAYLFSIDHPERPLHVFYANTGNAATFEQPRNVDERFFEEFEFPLENFEIIHQDTSARANIEVAMADAGIDGVDVWLGIGFGATTGSSTNLARFAVRVIKPRAYIPHHWDDFFAPSFFDGLTRAWTNEGLSEFLASVDVPIFIQGQYMDKYILEPSGVTFDINSEVKAALGLPDVAVVPVATMARAEMHDGLCLHR